MGDALCLMFVPPPTDSDEHYPSTTTTTTTPVTTSGERSSFRRSLNLSNGAFGLRRFSRSVFTESATSGSGSTNDNNASHRRSTIATSVPQNTNKLHVRIVPNIENPSRSLIFDIFDRELEPAVYVKVGRFTDRSHSANHMTFKSKVVSRAHCELWVENEKLYVRDTKSSSGTFLNHIRISPPNEESLPHEIKDGDIVQLGVDYQGGVEEIYRAVKMRFEVSRTRRQRPVSFNMTAFQNIRNLTNGGVLVGSTGVGTSGDAGTTFGASLPSGNQIQDHAASEPLPMSLNVSSLPPSLPADAPVTLAQDGLHAELLSEKQQQQQQQHLTTQPATVGSTTDDLSNPESNYGIDDLEECCICLYALAPHQALFVSPCAHSYHYKCIRPLLESYPGFQCPICRTYSDLDANINLESHEIMEKYGLCRHSTIVDPTSSITCIPTTTGTTQQQQEGRSLDENTTIPNTNDRGISASQPQPALDADDDMAPLAALPTLGHMDSNAHLSEPSARDHRQTVIMGDAATSTTRSAQHVNSANNNNNNSETGMNDHNQPQSVIPENHIVEDLLESQDTSTSQDATRSRRSAIVDTNVSVMTNTAVDNMEDTVPQQPSLPPSNSSPDQQPQRRVNASGFVEKLKMVLFEKRKSSSIVAPRERKRTNRPRPLSYPHFLRRHYDEDDGGHTDDEENYNDDHDEDVNSVHQSMPSSHRNNQQIGNNSSSVSANHNLSRQSTTHLAEIEEEEYPWHQHFSQYQPMSIDG